MELRDYQKEAVSVIEEMEPGENRLIYLPCGTGKTVIFSTVANKSKGKVLIVVPSTELRTQAIDKLKAIDPNVDVGSVQAQINEYDHRVVVATRQSLSHRKSTRLEKLLEDGEFEFVIFDECHQATSQIKLILKKLNQNIKVVGFSATPFNEELKDIFEKIHFQRGILEMIQNGYLCEPRAFKIKTGTDLNGVKVIAGEFNQRDLENTIDTPERNQQVVDAWKQFASDRKHTIIFTSGIEHSNHIMECFIANGIDCRTINSKNDKDDRAEILTAFANGEFPVITNCNILTTGFDMESIDCILLAAPTKSKIRFLQMIGRGMRLFPDKIDCLILDMKDSISKHDIMSIDDIFGLEIKSGESLTEAKERVEKEIAEAKEEQEAREQEYQRQQELIAQEIILFNANLEYALTVNSYYDWWKARDNCFALSVTSDFHYLIEKENGVFNVFEINTQKDNNHLELINSSNSALEMISFIETSPDKITSFMRKDTPWKQDPPTQAQLNAVKWGVVNNKWECHIYFSGWKVNKVMKSLKMAG